MATLGVMVLLLAGCLAFAMEAEKPWGRTVQKRLEKKQPLQPKEHAIIGLWWAAVINAGVLTLLIGTAGKWMPEPRHGSGMDAGETPVLGDKPPGTDAGRARSLPDFTKGRWRTAAWVLLLGAVVVGGWERWPKLHHSLWNDEEYALRKFAHGGWEEKNGAWKFEPVTWTDTLFESRNGNNHVLNSVSMRLGLDVWRAITGAPRDQFVEYPIRVPAYLAALGTIFMVYLLGRSLGAPMAGLAGAWLLALHPWHVRYSAEARGYAMMMFFMSVSLYAVLKALRTNKLGWWITFGLAEAVYLLCFAGSLHVAVMVNLFVLIELLRKKQWPQMRTLIAANLLGAMVVLQLMLPNIPQILTFLKEPQPNYVTDVWQWYRDLGSVMLVGWPYDNFLPDAHHGTDWLREGPSFIFSGSFAPYFLLLLGLAALTSAFLRGAAARIVIIAPVLAVGLTCALSVRPGSPMTVWYLIYILVPLVLAVPLLLEEAGQIVKWRWMSAVFLLWLVVRYGGTTVHAREVVRDVSRQPVREAVAFVRKESPEAMTATFGVSDRQSASYDPRVVRMEKAADLDGVIATARAAARPLYVYYCSDQFGERRVPDVYLRVTKSGEFEKLAEFPGSEELFSYRVYRLKQP